MLKLSLLITYRYRSSDHDIDLLINCLDSLRNQSYQNFELVLVDSGSPSWVKNQLSSYFVKPQWHYHYVDTEGIFWQKSLVLNHALHHAKGEYCMIIDADFVFSKNFIQLLHQQLKPDILLRYRFYRLKAKDTKRYPKVWSDALAIRKRSEAMILADTGAIVAERKAFLSVGCYDLFYRYWGKEDIDIQKRLQHFGLKVKDFDPSDATVFHQWHRHISEHIPRGWEQILANYFKQKFSVKEVNSKTLTHSSMPEKLLRPAKVAFRNRALKNVMETRLTYPYNASLSAFNAKFMSLTSGQGITLKVAHHLVKVEKDSRLGSWVLRLNRWFAKRHLSYRLVDLQVFSQGHFSEIDFRDWVFYFTLHHEDFILDYFFAQKEQESEFIVFRK